jgi:hypothetical protein
MVVDPTDGTALRLVFCGPDERLVTPDDVAIVPGAGGAWA